MMEDSGYVDNVLFRLRTYERNRIFVGDKLFFTYETGKEPLNTRVLDKFLRKLFCEEE